MKAPIATAVTMLVGIIVLLGYFVQVPILQNIRTQLLGWAVVLVGISALIGIINLIVVHWKKMTTSRKKNLYSGLLVISFLLTLSAGLWFGPADPQFQKVVTAIQVPVEATMMALLTISLAFASLRLFQRRRDLMGLVFILSAVLFLLLSSGFLATLQRIPALGFLLVVFNQLPVAGARGILLGIALGSLTTGLRILLGADRPYSG